MFPISQNLAQHLQGGVTTLCTCWRLTRKDGVVMGFTDHDADLSFDGTVFTARTGLEASEISKETGFAISGGEVSGALVSAGISESGIAAGLYDKAKVESFLVNWQQPDGRLLTDVSFIGEIRRQDNAFIAETRGLMHVLDQEQGRLYRASCSADVGDAKCGINLELSTWKASGTVEVTDGIMRLSCAALAGFENGLFSGGLLTFTSGANQGIGVEVKVHQDNSITLWQRLPQPVVVGDMFTVKAGCDKRFATCKSRFGNAVNFRGFPHMPGNDFIVRMPRQGEAGLDGGSLFDER